MKLFKSTLFHLPQVSNPEDRLYMSGCLEAGEKWLNSNLIPVAGFAVGVALVQVGTRLGGHNRLSVWNGFVLGFHCTHIPVYVLNVKIKKLYVLTKLLYWTGHAYEWVYWVVEKSFLVHFLCNIFWVGRLVEDDQILMTTPKISVRELFKWLRKIIHKWGD